MKVPDLTFSKFYNLQTIEWPPSLHIVGFSSFEQTAIKELVLPSSCRKIDNWAFAECEGLASAVCHGVDTVGSSAFNQCAALKWLDMPELKKIETDAFRGTALEAVELPKCEVIYSGGLASPSLCKVVVSSTAEIHHNAFGNATPQVEVTRLWERQQIGESEKKERVRRSVECKLGFQWISTFQLKLKALFRLAHTCSTGNRSFKMLDKDASVFEVFCQCATWNKWRLQQRVWEYFPDIRFRTYLLQYSNTSPQSSLLGVATLMGYLLFGAVPSCSAQFWRCERSLAATLGGRCHYALYIFQGGNLA